jgi:molybdopterin molybdotransferase
MERSQSGLLAYSAGDQNTGILKTMLHADALAILPAEAASFAVGDAITVHLLSSEMQMCETQMRDEPAR